MNVFALLFRMDLTTPEAQPSNEQMESYMQDWMEWIHELEENNRLADGGNHFSRSGRVLKPNGERIDSLHVADNTSIAGYILIHAQNLNEATVLAEKCPILKGENTSVEVRETAAP